MSEMGKRIKEIREKKHMNLEEFGRLFSPPASKSTVHNWEAGRNYPNKLRLQRLAELAEVSVDYLLFGKHDEDR
jgi:transcriptional regulator with XRE-family HTH domain